MSYIILKYHFELFRIRRNILFFVCLMFLNIPAQSEIIGPKLQRLGTEFQMVESLNNIMLVDEYGKQSTLRSYLAHGRPTLLITWERNCLNCLSEISGLSKIAEKCPDVWNIIFVSIDKMTYFNDLKKFNNYQLPWKLYYVKIQSNVSIKENMMQKFFFGETVDGIIATPLHYFVSKEGMVEAIVNAKIDFGEKQRLEAFCK